MTVALMAKEGREAASGRLKIGRSTQIIPDGGEGQTEVLVRKRPISSIEEDRVARRYARPVVNRVDEECDVIVRRMLNKKETIPGV